MTHQELAKQLRNLIILHNQQVTYEEMTSFNDDQMIDFFNTCSCCGEKFLTAIDLELAIKNSVNADDFIEISKALEYQRKSVTKN